MFFLLIYVDFPLHKIGFRFPSNSFDEIRVETESDIAIFNTFIISFFFNFTKNTKNYDTFLKLNNRLLY